MIAIDHLAVDRPTQGPRRSFVGEDAGVADQVYHLLMFYQGEMMKSGLNTTYLTQAMAALPNLDTVVFNHNDRHLKPWGAKAVEGQTGRSLTQTVVDGVDPDSVEFAEQALRAVILAISASSNVSLRKLEITLGAQRGAGLYLDMLAFPESVKRYIRQNPPGLTSLVLWLFPYITKRARQEGVRDVAGFISLFPKLQRLHLAFDRAEDYYKHFAYLSQGLQLQDLQFLKLSMIECTQGALTALLRSHKGTLKEVVLHLVDILPESGSWPSFLATVRDELSLQVLTVNLCSSDWKCVESCRQSGSGSVTVSRRFELQGTWQAWTDTINSIVMRDMREAEILWLPEEPGPRQ